MSAATIDNDNASFESPINKKRQNLSSHAKTQKFRQSSNDFNSQKVNSVLESIHNNNANDDDNLGNYNPKGSIVNAKHSDNFKPLNPYNFPDNPVSMSSSKKENMSNINNEVPQPLDNDDLRLQELQSTFMNDSQVRDYFKKLVPNYKPSRNSDNNKPYYPTFQNNNQMNGDINQTLIEKLNYMINLLEEQQDQKSNSTTEDIILYSFLGVFIIFVVDSFTRVGKYVR